MGFGNFVVQIRKVLFFFPFSNFLSLVSFFRVKLSVRISVRVKFRFRFRFRF